MLGEELLDGLASDGVAVGETLVSVTVGTTVGVAVAETEEGEGRAEGVGLFFGVALGVGLAFAVGDALVVGLAVMGTVTLCVRLPELPVKLPSPA